MTHRRVFTTVPIFHRLAAMIAALTVASPSLAQATLLRSAVQRLVHDNLGRGPTAVRTVRRKAAAVRTRTDLFELDQILPQGPGGECQAGLFHRQGRPR